MYAAIASSTSAALALASWPLAVTSAVSASLSWACNCAASTPSASALSASLAITMPSCSNSVAIRSARALSAATRPLSAASFERAVATPVALVGAAPLATLGATALTSPRDVLTWTAAPPASTAPRRPTLLPEGVLAVTTGGGWAVPGSAVPAMVAPRTSAPATRSGNDLCSRPSLFMATFGHLRDRGTAAGRVPMAALLFAQQQL